jgi:hypothetical protein
VNGWQALIAVVVGIAILYRINGRSDRADVPTTGVSAVREYIGKHALDAGVARFADAGWVVVSVVPMLINRGAAKWLIGFLARQRTCYVVTFRKGSAT